jgi:hydrogenase nickel incorporation protein HypB
MALRTGAPATFYRADLMVLNKIDLLPYVSFDAALAHEYARRVNPGIEIVNVSCTTGEGFDEWYRWLEAQRVEDAVAK